MRPFLRNLTEDFGVSESQYRNYYLASDIRQTSLAIGIWMFPLLLLAYSEFIMLGWSLSFAVSLAVRLLFCLFSLYTITVLQKVSAPRIYDYIFLRWAIIAVIVILFFNYTWAPFVPPTGAITILTLFSAYMVFPTKRSIRLVPPLTLSLGNLALQWLTGGFASLQAGLTILVAVVMANVLGIIFSSTLQKHRYTEFMSRLEESRSKEELVKHASTDELTGLYNRRKLFQLAREEYARLKNGQSFSVLMIDIDHFKNLNDRFGHEVGDLILTNFAFYVRNSLDTTHIWGRLGGDEFTLVLPNLSAEKAKHIAERLRLDINSAPVIWQEKPLMCAISVGITERREHDLSFEAILRRADEALYLAKRNGRNRTEVL